MPKQAKPAAVAEAGEAPAKKKGKAGKKKVSQAAAKPKVPNMGVWGIDIGQCGLKAIRLELVDGQAVATAFDYVEHPKILSQPDADPEQLTREALATFLERNELRGDQVAISVPGQSGLARFVKLPPVEEKKIPDIVRFEARQQIPFPLEEVVWDYQKIGAGVVTDGFAMETEVGLFAMKRDMISRYLGHFQGVNVEVHAIQMAPLALVNYVAYDLLGKNADGSTAGEEAAEASTTRGKPRCVVALDLGTESTNLVVTDGQKIIWQRPIPLGGNHFTKALSKDMKLTFAKAEHLKRNAAASPDLPKILKALKPVLSDFVSEVQRSLNFFTNTHRNAQVEYMVGLGAALRLPGLQKFISEKLGLEVRKPSMFERMRGDALSDNPVFKENLLSFPVAYGLALQGLGLAKLKTNLLPPEIHVERQIRAKKPWAAAAAAMFLAGTAIMTYGYAVVYGSVTDPKIEQAIGEGKSVVSAVQSQNSQITTKEGEVADTQSDVKTIIAGQDERLNWIAINEFINRNLPQPGPEGNLKLEQQRRYWFTTEGMQALNDYRNRITGGISIEEPVNFEVRPHLATVDIEAIYPRYTDNLEGYFTAAKQASKEMTGVALNGISPTDLENPPTGPGWVIELRGFTWHTEGEAFIKDCLLENLRRDVGRSQSVDPEKDPVVGDVSHFFVFRVDEDPRPQERVFRYINQPLLDSLIFGGGGGMMGGMMGGMGGMPGVGSMSPGGGFGGSPPAFGGASQDEGFPGMGGGMAAPGLSSWQPLTGGGGGGPGGPGGPMGMGGSGNSGGASDEGSPGGGGFPGGPPPGMGGPFGGGGFSPMNLPGAPGGGRGSRFGSPPGGPGGLPGGPGSIPGGTPGGTLGSRQDEELPSRFEFIVHFIWKEPVTTNPDAGLAPPVDTGFGSGFDTGGTGGSKFGS